MGYRSSGARMFRRAGWGAICIGGVFFAAMAGNMVFVLGYQSPTDLPEKPVIVVLGGGRGSEGSLDPPTRARIRVAAEVYGRVGATRIVMTGYGAARAMAEAAVTEGLPRRLIVVEPQGRSTLHSALLTRQGMAGPGPLVVVSQRYHLLRSWLSFLWAGHRDITLMPADGRSDYRWDHHDDLALEALKLAVNAARALAASGLHLVGVPQNRYEHLLD